MSWSLPSSRQWCNLLRALCRAQLWALAACGLAGCRSGDAHNQKPLPDLPEAFGEAEAGLSTSERDGWLSFFGDPELRGLLEQALEGSPSLSAAQARLQQAEARAGIAGSALWPTVEASIEASRRHAPLGRGVGGVSQDQSIQTFNTFRASLAASYEVDLWGRLGDEEAAALLAAESANARVAAARMTLAANLTEAWLDVLLSRQRLEVLDEQEEVSLTLLKLTEELLANGQSSALSVARQEQQYLGVRELRQREEAQLAAAQARVSILVGEAPQGSQERVESRSFPDLPTVPEFGVPADLIYRRPDLRAALSGLRAQERRLAAALADRLPGLRLQGSLFAEAMEWDELFEDLFWQVAASLSEELLDGGREAARIDEQRAIARERYSAFHDALLNALGEVATTAAQYGGQVEAVALLEGQLEAASQAVELANFSYASGEVSYLELLDTVRTAQQLELQLLQARRQVLALHVQLCRALGGEWLPDGSQGTASHGKGG